MVTVILNRQKHVSLLADHSKDPITQLLLKVGDEVVVCAKCKSVYLKDVWVETKGGECCKQTETTTDIPGREFGSLKRNTSNTTSPREQVVTKRYPGLAIFFAIVAIVTGIYGYQVKQAYDREVDGKLATETRIEGEEQKNRTLQSQMSSLNTEKAGLSTANEKLANIISGISLIGGVRYNDRKDTPDTAYWDTPVRVYFTVKSPIVLKSVTVDANGTGTLTVKIYDSNGTEIGKAYNNEITAGREQVDFNTELPAGNYYLLQEDTISLLYNTSFSGYPVKSNEILDITGTNNVDQKYYFYYYDWVYSILP